MLSEPGKFSIHSLKDIVISSHWERQCLGRALVLENLIVSSVHTFSLNYLNEVEHHLRRGELQPAAHRLHYYCQQVVVAIILALKCRHDEELSKGVSMVLVVAIYLFMVAHGWSRGQLGWLVPSKLFPLKMRSMVQTVVAQCFLAALCHLRWGVFVLFVWLIVVMSIFVILLRLETKQVPIEEI
ncbi:hypothetical protein HU200_057077 [Digitaria exilis]|uniref:Uncharacterized protein n=1 Tax=Digitaria exilis TaxID=1010633 RepID=A0A835E394_9POAL|nr:hypothetical protein HU200_057077 [Digitaria exilis]